MNQGILSMNAQLLVPPVPAPRPAYSWRLAGRAVGVLLLLVLIPFLADLLLLALSPIMDGFYKPLEKKDIPRLDSRAWMKQEYREELATLPRPRRVMRLHASPNRTTLEFELQVQADHPLARTLTGWVPPEDLCALAFGAVTLNRDVLTSADFSQPEWNVKADTLTWTVRVSPPDDTFGYISLTVRPPDDDPFQTPKLIMPPPEPPFLHEKPVGPPVAGKPANAAPEPDGYDLLIELDRVKINSSGIVPEKVTTEDARIRLGKAGSHQFYLSLAPTVQGGDAKQASPENSRRAHLARFGQFPAARASLWGGGYFFLTSLAPVVPIIVVLFLLRRNLTARYGHPRSVWTFLRGIVLLHLVLHALQIYSFLHVAKEWVDSLWRMWFRTYSFFPSGASYGLIPVFLGVLVPAALLGARHRSAGRLTRGSRSPRSRLLWCIGGAGCFVSLLVWAIAAFQPGAPAWGVVVSAGSLMCFCLWLAFWTLSLLLGGVRWPRMTALGATLITLTLVLLAAVEMEKMLKPDGKTDGSNWEKWVELGIQLLAAATLLTALACSTSRFGLRLSGCSKLPWWAWGGVFVLAILSAVPGTAILKSFDQPRWGASTSFSFYYEVGRLVLVLWYAVPVWFLYHHGGKGLRIDGPVRWVGLVAAASLFFGLQQWFAIPLNFLFGLALLVWFVRPPVPWGDSVDSLAYARTAQPLTTLLSTIQTLGLAETAVRERRQTLRGKVASGDLSPTAFEAALKKLESEIEQIRKSATVWVHPAREVVFALGPKPTAWENGMHGARWSLTLALPWLVVFLVSYLGEPVRGGYYPLWDFVIDVGTSLMKWTGFGFFFGYFFPYLRGRSGLGKGLLFCLVLLAPTLPLLLLEAATTESRQGGGFWALQVFIHCLLLGLFGFDYAVIRTGERDWRALLEIHGLTSVSVTVSSVAAAIGATVVALVQTNTAALVTAFMTFVLPQPPPPPPKDQGQEKRTAMVNELPVWPGTKPLCEAAWVTVGGAHEQTAVPRSNPLMAPEVAHPVPPGGV